MRRVLLRVPSRDRRPHPCGLQNSGSRHQGGNVGRQSAAGRPRSSLACADDVAIIARAGDLEAQCLALLVSFRFAALAGLERPLAIPATSGQAWPERTGRPASHMLNPDISSQALI